MTTDYMPSVEEIVGHFERHLARFGQTLFIKRDNGGNLNHRAVNDLLYRMMVIPINSPSYSSGNNDIEDNVGRLEGWLARRKATAISALEQSLLVQNAAHALNHRPRRCLFRQKSFHSYFDSFRLRYCKR